MVSDFRPHWIRVFLGCPEPIPVTKNAGDRPQSSVNLDPGRILVGSPVVPRVVTAVILQSHQENPASPGLQNQENLLYMTLQCSGRMRGRFVGRKESADISKPNLELNSMVFSRKNLLLLTDFEHFERF